MNNHADPFDDWRERAASESLTETLQAMRAYLRGRLPDEHNECILRLRDLARLEVDERKRKLTREEARVEGANIADSALDLIDVIEKKVIRSRHTEHPIPTPILLEPVNFNHLPEEAGLEKIIGANNLKRVDWLRLGLERARSIGRITTPFNLGTGFLIRGGRLVTNYHVLPSEAMAAKAYVEFNVEEDWQGNLTPAVRYEFDPTSFRGDKALDYCVITVKPREGAPALETWGTLEFELGKMPQVGEHVTIIQHPAGGVKQIALTANQVVNLHEFRLQYATDTMPGSSGSPVFNDDWKVVALHHKGGNLVADASGHKIYANEGILLSAIAPQLG
jgi:V8-like Glu-specific endopeptidase